MALIFLAALALGVQAATTTTTTISGLPGTFTTSTFCYTFSGTKSVTPVPTTLRHNTSTLYKTKTSTTYKSLPVVTVYSTAPPYTFTSIPIYTNPTWTSTVNTIGTTTTFTYDPRSTITSTVSNFYPIASATKYANPTAYPYDKRQVPSSPTAAPTKWPSSVKCTDKVTFYGTKTTTLTFLQSTSTSTIYSYATVTAPTTTVPATVVTRTTSTTTQTQIFYARRECLDPRNRVSGIVWPSDGQYYPIRDYAQLHITGYYADYNLFDFEPASTDANNVTSAEACCAYCFAKECQGSAWTEGTPTRRGKCDYGPYTSRYDKYPACHTTASLAALFHPRTRTATPAGPAPTIVLSNGPCGGYVFY